MHEQHHHNIPREDQFHTVRMAWVLAYDIACPGVLSWRVQHCVQCYGPDQLCLQCFSINKSYKHLLNMHRPCHSFCLATDALQLSLVV